MELSGNRSSMRDDARMAEGKKMCHRVCSLPHLLSAVLSMAGTKQPISSCHAAPCGTQVPREVCREGDQVPLSGVCRGFAQPNAKGRKPMTLHGSFASRSENLPSAAWSLQKDKDGEGATAALRVLRCAK